MAEHAHHEDHGHSVAAWTGVVIILVGSAVASWGVAVASATIFWIGIAVCILGAIAGKLLGMAGYGAKDVAEPEETEKTSGVR
jgi:multisubunit Na+/H+ antiporter MnhG subunit